MEWSARQYSLDCDVISRFLAPPALFLPELHENVLWGGREARLARDRNREYEAFSGHQMRSPAGTERGGVSMTDGRQGQGSLEQGRGKGWGAIACHDCCFFLGRTYVFLLCVPTKEVASACPF